jgi:hypothetical protein
MTIYRLGFSSLALAFLFVPRAEAYLDPGTISMVLQGVIGAVAAALVAGKLYWHKIKSMFQRSSTPHHPAEEPLSTRQNESSVAAEDTTIASQEDSRSQSDNHTST